MTTLRSIFGIIFFVAVSYLLAACDAKPSTEQQLVRLAKLVIDSAQLTRYTALLQEEINASMEREPGVLTLYAVAEKNNPTHITILEIYADSAAYRSHIKTPHFQKYKKGTENMVLSLELVETLPLIPGMKIK